MEKQLDLILADIPDLSEDLKEASLPFLTPMPDLSALDSPGRGSLKEDLTNIGWTAEQWLTLEELLSAAPSSSTSAAS